MALAELTPYAHDWQADFEYPDPRIITDDKTNRIIGHGPDRLVVIADWDGVFTAKEQIGPAGTNFGVMRSCMTGENQLEHEALLNTHLTLEKQGKLTASVARFWQTSALALMSGVALDKLTDRAREMIKVRDGAKAFSDVCKELGIPIVIKSTGEAHMIEAVADENGLEPTVVVANRLHTVNGVVIPRNTNDPASIVVPGTLVDSFNKNSFSHHELLDGPARDNVVLLGDNIHDLDMVHDHEVDTALRMFQDGGKEAVLEFEGLQRWQELQSLRSLAGNRFDILALRSDFRGPTSFIGAVALGHTG